MAQIDIPESVGRDLYYHYFSLPADYFIIDITEKNWKRIYRDEIKRLKLEHIVIKPDYPIGKRGKNNLLAVNKSPDDGISFLQEKTGTSYEGFSLNRFIVMPYIPHTKEYYIAFTTEPLTDNILFSPEGGIDIEENWKKMIQKEISVASSEETYDELLTGIPEKTKTVLADFITSFVQYARAYGFAFLELNPFIIQHNRIIPLDFKGRLDDCSFFKLQQYVPVYSWGDRIRGNDTPEEQYIKELDSLTGASLKLKILNKNGSVWPMVSGGGASIIYFDSLVDKGMAEEIAFYGEYSGNPSFELTYEYAKTIFTLMLASPAKNKILLIAGGNANFQDIAVTFMGIEKALEEFIDEIKKQKIRILVRRGGPNVKEAFIRLRKFSQKHNMPIIIEGVETSLVTILEHM